MMVSFNFTPRSDFAHELINDKKEGYKVIKKVKNNVISTKVEVLDKYNSINKKVGTYYSIEFSNTKDKKDREDIIDILTYELKSLLKNKGFKYGDSILVVGLGNRYVTADALGPMSASKVIVSNHLFEINEMMPKGSSKVCVLSPGVMGQTGMETSDIIKSINSKLKADFIIVIDALASMNIKRINKMIQITDTGISPGSGIGNKRKEISFENLKTPVIAIGVATVVEISNVIYQVLRQSNIEDFNLIKDFISQSEYQLVVTPKEIDEDVMHISDIIATSLNKTFHQNYLDF
jgi:spore protease